MSAVEELLHDHQILRAKLDLLEEWLPFAHAAPFTIRNILSALARRLRSHTEKEERLLESLEQTQRRPPQLTTYRPDEHQDQQQTLTILLELLARGQECPVEHVETSAAHLIDGLREHMAEEHTEQRVALREVNALLLGGINAPVNRVLPPLARLIEDLREHMAHEEQEVFPLVDHMAQGELQPLSAPWIDP